MEERGSVAPSGASVEGCRSALNPDLLTWVRCRRGLLLVLLAAASNSDSGAGVA